MVHMSFGSEWRQAATADIRALERLLRRAEIRSVGSIKAHAALLVVAAAFGAGCATAVSFASAHTFRSSAQLEFTVDPRIFHLTVLDYLKPSDPGGVQRELDQMQRPRFLAAVARRAGVSDAEATRMLSLANLGPWLSVEARGTGRAVVERLIPALAATYGAREGAELERALRERRPATVALLAGRLSGPRRSVYRIELRYIDQLLRVPPPTYRLTHLHISPIDVNPTWERAVVGAGVGVVAGMAALLLLGIRTFAAGGLGDPDAQATA